MVTKEPGPGFEPGGSAFPSTRWSRIVGTESQARTEPDIEALAVAYWPPVYGYVRACWSLDADEAKDCTQDFFVWMLEQGFLGKADPSRGRFRAFLKATLRNFLSDRERRRRAAKRGGGKTHIQIDFSEGTLPDLGPEWKSRTPDEMLDSLWRAALVERATETLEAELTTLGKEVHFAVFRDYFLNQHEDIDYQQLADRHQISTAQVSNYLMYAKGRYRALLRTAVMETVSNIEDLEDELRWLFGRKE